MSSLPIEVLLGIYLGLLTGIVPAFVAGALGFLARYFTGVTLPGFGVVVLALAIASVNGGLLVLAEPEIVRSPRLLVAVLVVIMLALYAHSQGDKLGSELPKRVSLTAVRKRTLSADAVEFVGSVGQVTVRPAGPIRDMEGFPPLSPSLREALAAGSWRLPADLPLSELEHRLETRLRTDHDLADVAVSLDDRGRATITAAPPSSGLSKRVPEGSRAVTLETLVPTGLARDDTVVLETPTRSVDGTVLSVDATHVPSRAADGQETAENAPPAATPATESAGGRGRVTVAVARRDVSALLESDSDRLLVRSRGTSPALEARSLLSRTETVVERVVVDTHTPVPADGAVRVLAVLRTAGSPREPTSDRRPWRWLRPGRGETGSDRPQTWVFAPGIERALEAGDEVFVAGPERAVDRFVAEASR
ncbi:potassium transporter TrkA [Natronobiforma cellulositropha]|uniref:potassium transporter TrkA n=1 Tax=Natronobiforma cellulositropha TaxID=1679076 RepID=UPI0021D57A8C|nr:potassium transporter TrkA [Natronobiforma cellulositropha]